MEKKNVLVIYLKYLYTYFKLHSLTLNTININYCIFNN